MPVILPPSLRGWGNQAIFARRSPTAIRNIRPFRPRRKQMPETSRSGTSTTRHTRSRFLFALPVSPWERVSADIRENVQPLPDDFSVFCLKNSNVGDAAVVSRSALGEQSFRRSSAFNFRGPARPAVPASQSSKSIRAWRNHGVCHGPVVERQRHLRRNWNSRPNRGGKQQNQ